jgi:hypothetical protein
MPDVDPVERSRRAIPSSDPVERSRRAMSMFVQTPRRRDVHNVFTLVLILIVVLRYLVNIGSETGRYQREKCEYGSRVA